jgi:hypothetical protein
VFERARAHEKIAFMTPYVVEEVHNVANKSVEAVRVRNLDNLCTVSSLLICLNGVILEFIIEATSQESMRSSHNS